MLASLTRPGLLTAALLAALVVQACYNVEGPEAPLDQFYFPQAMVAHPDGRHLYVVSTNFDGRYRDRVGGTVHVVDTESLEILGSQSIRIASFAGVPTFATTEDGDRLLLPSRGDRSLHVIEVSDDGDQLRCQGRNTSGDCRIENLPTNPVRAITVPGQEGETLVAVASMSGRVALVRLDGGSAENARFASLRVSEGTNILALHPLTDTLYAGGRFDWGLYAVHWALDSSGAPETIVVSRRVPLQIDAGPRGLRSTELRGIAFSSDGTRAYVAAANPGGIFVIDSSLDPDTGLSRDRYIERFDVDGRPGDIVVINENGQDFLYVSSSERDEIVVIHPGSGQTVQRIPVGRRPWGLTADPVLHQRLYVSLFEQNAVDIIDVNPGRSTWRTVIGTIE